MHLGELKIPSHAFLLLFLTLLHLASGREAGKKDRGSPDTSNIFIKTELLGLREVVAKTGGLWGCTETVVKFMFIIVRFPNQDVTRVKEGGIHNYIRSIGVI